MMLNDKCQKGNNTTHLEKEKSITKPQGENYKKLLTDHPRFKKEFLLSLAVIYRNETLGHEGVVPSA